MACKVIIGCAACEREVETRRQLHLDAPTLTEQGAFAKWMDHNTKLDCRIDAVVAFATAVMSACLIGYLAYHGIL